VGKGQKWADLHAAHKDPTFDRPVRHTDFLFNGLEEGANFYDFFFSLEEKVLYWLSISRYARGSKCRCPNT